MTIKSILSICKHSAGNVKWSHKEGKFVAIFGGRGMKTIFGPFVRRHDIAMKAASIQRELIAAKKGDLNAETEELWDRKTNKRVVTGAPFKAPSRHR